MQDADPNWFSLTVPTLSDPGLAPPGDHVMNLTALVDAEAVKTYTDAGYLSPDAGDEDVIREGMGLPAGEVY